MRSVSVSPAYRRMSHFVRLDAQSMRDIPGYGGSASGRRPPHYGVLGDYSSAVSFSSGEGGEENGDNDDENGEDGDDDDNHITVTAVISETDAESHVLASAAAIAAADAPLTSPTSTDSGCSAKRVLDDSAMISPPGRETAARRLRRCAHRSRAARNRDRNGLAEIRHMKTCMKHEHAPPPKIGY